MTFDEARLEALRACVNPSARPRPFDLALASHALHRHLAASSAAWSEERMLVWLVYPEDRPPFIESLEEGRAVIGSMLLRGWLVPDGAEWKEGPHWRAGGGHWPGA